MYSKYHSHQIVFALIGAFVFQASLYIYLGNHILFSNHLFVGLELIVLYFLSGKLFHFLFHFEQNTSKKSSRKKQVRKSKENVHSIEEARIKRNDRRKHLRKTIGEDTSKGNWSTLLQSQDNEVLKVMNAVLSQYDIESFVAERPVYSIIPGIGGEMQRIVVKTDDLARARNIMRQHDLEISN